MNKKEKNKSIHYVHSTCSSTERLYSALRISLTLALAYPAVDPGGNPTRQQLCYFWNLKYFNKIL